jgi:hypothetical protein
VNNIEHVTPKRYPDGSKAIPSDWRLSLLRNRPAAAVIIVMPYSVRTSGSGIQNDEEMYK